MMCFVFYNWILKHAVSNDHVYVLFGERFERSNTNCWLVYQSAVQVKTLSDE